MVHAISVFDQIATNLASSAKRAGVERNLDLQKYRGDRIRTCDLLVPNQAL